MLNRFWIRGAVGAWLACGLTASALAQDDKDKPGQPEMNAEEAAWMAAAQPGENHKLLEPFVGKWTVQMKFYQGEQAMEGTGTEENEWMLGGRYVGTNYMGNFMGMPFEGHGVLGYDNVKKKFITGWIDNMGTGVLTEEGTYDAAKKEFTMLSEFPSPVGGKIKQRTVVVLESADKRTTTFYHTKDGKEAKIMELTYTRSGGKGAEGMGGK